MELINKTQNGKCFQGDCLEVMKMLPDNSIETLITDPPAGISFMGKEWDYHKGGRQQWVDYMSERFREALRIIKPAGLAIVWALPRTAHWTATALEDAGWYIDTKIYHLFGGGWPKGTDISKGIDKYFGCEREKIENPYKDRQTAIKNITTMGDMGPNNFIEPISVHPLAQKWNGYRSQLKTMAEEWITCRKPIDKNFATNALKYGVAGYNIDGCWIKTEELSKPYSKRKKDEYFGKKGGFSDSGPVNKKGRYPGNVIIDDMMAEDMDKKIGILKTGEKKPGKYKKGYWQNGKCERKKTFIVNYGGPSRYFTRCNFELSECDYIYTGKAIPSEKNRGLEDMPEQNGHKGSPRRDNKKQGEIKTKCSHPTVKSLALMRHLCMISKPPDGGIVLDIFAGTFSTLIAAYQTNRKFIGIEINKQYCKEGLARLRAAMEQRRLFDG